MRKAKSARRQETTRSNEIPLTSDRDTALDVRNKYRAQALELLQDADFFGRVRNAVSRNGLVGEARNALAIFVIAISSLLDRPLNALVKGPSSSGKNFIVRCVLRLFPRNVVREITSSSKTAWNYSQDDFRNRIVYLQERNDRAGAIDQVRQFISEGRLVRIVSVREGGRWVTKEFIAEGPIAVISTTTRDQIEIDDETRNISLWVDDSSEQTGQIVKGYNPELPPVAAEQIDTWREAYELIAQRKAVPIKLPEWFKIIAASVPTADVRVRRYYPAFVEAVRTVALIRSFRTTSTVGPTNPIQVTFVDYAITVYIFERIFAESLYSADDDAVETRNVIQEIASSQEGESVGQEQVAEYLKISATRAYKKLSAAREAGLIVQANTPKKNNEKRYLPAPRPRFVPAPKEVIEKILTIRKPVSFVHPVNGKNVTLGTPEKKERK